MSSRKQTSKSTNAAASNSEQDDVNVRNFEQSTSSQTSSITTPSQSSFGHSSTNDPSINSLNISETTHQNTGDRHHQDHHAKNTNNDLDPPPPRRTLMKFSSPPSMDTNISKRQRVDGTQVMDRNILARSIRRSTDNSVVAVLIYNAYPFRAQLLSACAVPATAYIKFSLLNEKQPDFFVETTERSHFVRTNLPLPNAQSLANVILLSDRERSELRMSESLSGFQLITSVGLHHMHTDRFSNSSELDFIEEELQNEMESCTKRIVPLLQNLCNLSYESPIHSSMSTDTSKTTMWSRYKLHLQKIHINKEQENRLGFIMKYATNVLRNTGKANVSAPVQEAKDL